MFQALENEIQNACGKNKRMDQLKWSTVVKKLWQIKANLAQELAGEHEPVFVFFSSTCYYLH
jgi:hypothetical protein